jgi:hypothetical protein
VTCNAERLAFPRIAKSLLQRPVKFALAAIIVTLACSVPALAHVGSPDVYAEGNAGPYRLLVTIRPPQVIPGVAEIEVEEADPQTPEISSIEITPIPLTGEASKHPPVADRLKNADAGGSADVSFYSGSLWIMASGSWQIRFTVKGSWGDGVLSIPVPATSSSTRGMQTGLGVLLASLGLLLVVGVIGIAGAAARDAQLPPGAVASKQANKRARIAMACALVAMIAAVWFGNQWWKGEADSYARYVYKPLTMQPELQPDHTLVLKIEDPGWIKSRKLDDFVLDHDHLMHLYLIRQPGIDVVYHLHPEQIAPGEFQLALPSIPAGLYNLYADVVHATGFPETLVAQIELPEIAGRALNGDDAKGIAQPLNPLRGEPNGCPVNPVAGSRSHLPDGYTMVWDNAAKLPAKTPQIFEFSLFAPDGKPAPDMVLYMGMVGHAAFVKEDGTVFAHVHPSGTVSMAALGMAAAQNQPSQPESGTTALMPGMSMSSAKVQTSGVPNTIGFPYGFPTAGAYRIFVQMKHGQTIETAAFDACAGFQRAN